jgi:hypothetical protein
LVKKKGNLNWVKSTSSTSGALRRSQPRQFFSASELVAINIAGSLGLKAIQANRMDARNSSKPMDARNFFNSIWVNGCGSKVAHSRIDSGHWTTGVKTGVESTESASWGEPPA